MSPPDPILTFERPVQGVLSRCVRRKIIRQNRANSSPAYKGISLFASREQALSPNAFPADLRLPKIDTETHQRAFIWFS